VVRHPSPGRPPQRVDLWTGRKQEGCPAEPSTPRLLDSATTRPAQPQIQQRPVP
jgi:hypothetical protein